MILEARLAVSPIARQSHQLGNGGREITVFTDFDIEDSYYPIVGLE